MHYSTQNQKLRKCFTLGIGTVQGYVRRIQATCFIDVHMNCDLLFCFVSFADVVSFKGVIIYSRIELKLFCCVAFVFIHFVFRKSVYRFISGIRPSFDLLFLLQLYYSCSNCIQVNLL